MNTARATLKGTIVVIEDSSVKVVPYILFGLLCVTFGVTIYIILPVALLAENAGVILDIFFLILVGLILGLTLLTANLRGMFETFFVYLLFFWERKSMRALLKKNLMAHKQTNKLTSIIYALTLGCVIFLCVSLNLLLKSVQSYGVMPDSDITVYVDKYTGESADLTLLASMIDPTLEQY